MTTNQIAYFSAKEQQRHNLQDESIRRQTNTINESHFARMDSETLRHNLATEQQAREQLNLGYAQLDLGNRQLEETQRHNYASESLSLGTLQESARHNRASELIASNTLAETVSHNRETEKQADKVNGAAVVANYSQSNLNSRNAELAAQRTETEKKQQSLLDAQNKLVSEQTLTQQKITKYQGAKDVSTIVKNYVTSGASLIRAVGGLMGPSTFGAKAGTSALDQLEAGFYSQLEY